MILKKGTATIFLFWKRLKIVAVPFLSILFMLVTSVNAQEEKKDEIPPKGMEIINVGSAKAIIPKDMKLTESKGLIIQEDLTVYVARVIADMQERVDKIESGQEKIKKEIAELRKNLEAKLKDNPQPKQKANEGG